jgi:hypothetical protein
LWGPLVWPIPLTRGIMARGRAVRRAMGAWRIYRVTRWRAVIDLGRMGWRGTVTVESVRVFGHEAVDEQHAAHNYEYQAYADPEGENPDYSEDYAPYDEFDPQYKSPLSFQFTICSLSFPNAFSTFSPVFALEV